MSSIFASSHEYPHVEKKQESSEQSFIGMVAQPTVKGKELTSGQKEKLLG